MPVNVLIQLRNAGKYYLKAAQRICRASLLCLPAFCSVTSRGSSQNRSQRVEGLIMWMLHQELSMKVKLLIYCLTDGHEL